tara:strand:- start:1681 stop:2142 length:462 start_codon:yes stop_codon:yes gene_type:complete
MQIFIITICNKKDDYTKTLVDKYTLLIKKFYQINFINIGFQKKKIKKNLYEEEYKKAVSLIKPDSFVIALDENGVNLGSKIFSDKMKKLSEDYKNLYFIVGGPDGLSEYVLNISNMALSLSNLTFPHQIAKVILTEQIYRSICIMNNHPYHRQ